MYHVLCMAAFRPICMLLLYAITPNPGRLFLVGTNQATASQDLD